MKVLVTGSSGYVGAKLVPVLIKRGYNVACYDWLNKSKPYDIRNKLAISQHMIGCDYVIHLANISNDPSFDLAPDLAKTVNWECFPYIVKMAAACGVKRFIFASSSSVYGVKEEKDVTENLPLEPLTDYSKYKALCEEYLFCTYLPNMEFVIVRPATVCGYSPSMRLDLLVNIFTHHAWRHGKINVHGGQQYRPNIHIDDMVDAYIALLEYPGIHGEVFNVGYQNLTLLETAEMVKSIVGSRVKIKIEESRDPRSYHVNSDKVKSIFTPKRTVEDAIKDMVEAFDNGLIPDPDNDKYYRVRQLKGMK